MVFFGQKGLAIPEFYGTITVTCEWDVDFVPGWRIGLTHTVDPYWGCDVRLWAEEKITAAPAGGSKIRSEKTSLKTGQRKF